MAGQYFIHCIQKKKLSFGKNLIFPHPPPPPRFSVEIVRFLNQRLKSEWPYIPDRGWGKNANNIPISMRPGAG